MRLLRRNMTVFEYLPWLGEDDTDPETGLHTGEPVPSYGEPEEFEGNISAASLTATQQQFGTDIRYTHVAILDDPDTGINEYGLIRWNDELYDIRAVRVTLNATSLALRRQTANHAETEEEPEPDPDPEDGGEDDDEP